MLGALLLAGLCAGDALAELHHALEAQAPAPEVRARIEAAAFPDVLGALEAWPVGLGVRLREALLGSGSLRYQLVRECVRGSRPDLAAGVLVEAFRRRLVEARPFHAGVIAYRHRVDLVQPPGLRVRAFIPRHLPVAMGELLGRWEQALGFPAPLVIAPQAFQRLNEDFSGSVPVQPAALLLERLLFAADLGAVRLLRGLWVVPRDLAKRFSRGLPENEIELYRLLLETEARWFRDGLNALRRERSPAQGARVADWMASVGLPVLVEQPGLQDVFAQGVWLAACARRILIPSGPIEISRTLHRDSFCSALATRVLLQTDWVDPAPVGFPPRAVERAREIRSSAGTTDLASRWIEAGGREIGRGELSQLEQAVARSPGSATLRIAEGTLPLDLAGDLEPEAGLVDRVLAVRPSETLDGGVRRAALLGRWQADCTPTSPAEAASYVIAREGRIDPDRLQSALFEQGVDPRVLEEVLCFAAEPRFAVELAEWLGRVGREGMEAGRGKVLLELLLAQVAAQVDADVLLAGRCRSALLAPLRSKQPDEPRSEFEEILERAADLFRGAEPGEYRLDLTNLGWVSSR